MKKLLVYLRDYRKETILAPLFKMLEATLELFVPLVVAAIIDVGIAGRDASYIIRMVLVLVLLGAAGLGFSVTAQYFSAKAAVGFVAKLRHVLFAHIQKLSYAELDTVGTSTLITRLTSDMNQVQSGLNLTLRLLLRSPFVVIGAMVMAFTVDTKAALVFVVDIPALAVVVFGIMIASIPLYRRVQKRLDGVLGLTRENLTGVRVLRAFCKEEEQTAEFKRRNEELTDTQKFVGKISALLNPVTYVIVNAAIIALIWVGAIRVDMGILTQGAVVALYNYMAQILTELIKLANLIINITKSIACGNRIQAVLDVEPSIRDAEGIERQCFDRNSSAREAFEQRGKGMPDVSEKKNMARNTADLKEQKVSGKLDKNFEPASFSNREERFYGKAVSALDGVSDKKESRSGQKDGDFMATEKIACVEFKNASLKYPLASEEALSDITFSAASGETIGVIGGTGSGKTSLVNLIPRFYDCCRGQVLVDGRDVREYGLVELREKIGVVPQKAVLFAGTIRENLQWGKADATEEEMLSALSLAQVRDVIEKKENGLDSVVEQGGRNFSGGQRQRLTIARALVGKSEILILDDSSSALDFATDAALRQAIAGMEPKPTLFIVSQRTSSVRGADRIVVLDDGEAVGVGTHDELLENCAVYREIYESQFSGAAATDKVPDSHEKGKVSDEILAKKESDSVSASAPREVVSSMDSVEAEAGWNDVCDVTNQKQGDGLERKRGISEKSQNQPESGTDTGEVMNDGKGAAVE